MCLSPSFSLHLCVCVCFWISTAACVYHWGLLRCIGWHSCYHTKAPNCVSRSDIDPSVRFSGMHIKSKTHTDTHTCYVFITLWRDRNLCLSACMGVYLCCVSHSSYFALRGRLPNPQRREQKGPITCISWIWALSPVQTWHGFTDGKSGNSLFFNPTTREQQT